METIYRLYTDYIKTIERLYIDFIQTITDYIKTRYRLYTNYIEAIYRLYTDYIYIYRLYTDYVETIYRLHTDHIRLYTDYINTLYSFGGIFFASIFWPENLLNDKQVQRQCTVIMKLKSLTGCLDCIELHTEVYTLIIGLCKYTSFHHCHYF